MVLWELIPYTAIVVGKIGYHMASLTQTQILALNEVRSPRKFSGKQPSDPQKALTAAEVLRNTANSCVKLSVLHLYLTIFPTRHLRYAILTVMIVVTCYWAISLLRMVFICHPVAYEWNKNIEGGTCLNTTAAYYSVSAINLGLDLVIIILPMPILWTLQMPIAKKVAISIIFGMGIV